MAQGKTSGTDEPTTTVWKIDTLLHSSPPTPLLLTHMDVPRKEDQEGRGNPLNIAK